MAGVLDRPAWPQAMIEALPDPKPFGCFDYGLSPDQEERARDLHASSIVIDLLCQGPCGHRSFSPEMDEQIADYLGTFPSIADAWNYVVELPVRRALQEEDDGELESCWRSSGVTAGTRERDFNSLKDVLAGTSLAHAQFRQLPWFREAIHSADIRAAKHADCIAGFINSQDTVGFGTDLSLLECARDLGLVMLQLTYNTANFVGSGCTERQDGGLTTFGARLVRRANELGVLIDVSHCGPTTTLDACAVSKAPVIASHISAKTLYDVARAKSDDEIRAIVQTGGIVGVYAMPFFLSPEPQPTIETMLDHIDYLVALVGANHVALGTDWPLQMSKAALQRIAQPWTRAFGFTDEHRVDCSQCLVGFDDYRDFPNITRGLVARGYSDADIRRILGENFLRVLDLVAPGSAGPRRTSRDG